MKFALLILLACSGLVWLQPQFYRLIFLNFVMRPEM